MKLRFSCAILLAAVMALLLAACAGQPERFNYVKVSGRKVGKISLQDKETLEAGLRKKFPDDVDFAVERKLVPNGGVLKVKDNKYFSANPIIKTILKDSLGEVACDDAEVSDSNIPIAGHKTPGAATATTFTMRKTKTRIDCKVGRKLAVPALMIFVGTRGDTVSQYRIELK